MAIEVVNGATLQCSGAVPPGTTTFIVLPVNRVMAGGQPAANIMDFKPMVNIPTFGACMLPSNPQVAAATSAAMGVLTPMPCLPVIPAPWTTGSPTVPLANVPALNNTSKCMCMWGGVVSVMVPGQMTVMEP